MLILTASYYVNLFLSMSLRHIWGVEVNMYFH